MLGFFDLKLVLVFFLSKVVFVGDVDFVSVCSCKVIYLKFGLDFIRIR